MILKREIGALDHVRVVAVYLVHHTLCAGPFISVTQWPFGDVVNFCILVAMSVGLAFVLKLISRALRLARIAE